MNPNANRRVIKQTMADGAITQFAYTLDVNGKVTQTDVTDPRGNTERLTFDGAGKSSPTSAPIRLRVKSLFMTLQLGLLFSLMQFRLNVKGKDLTPTFNDQMPSALNDTD